jgi:hypothetical protein
MAMMKRATATLHKVGIPLNVHKRLWGYALENPMFKRQRSICHKTVQLAIEAAMNGERPTDLSRGDADEGC